MDAPSEKSVEVTPLYDANVPTLDPLDEEYAFSGDTVRSVLICGSPGAGKTEAIKNILHLNRARLCDVVVATHTKGEWEKTGATIVDAYVESNTDHLLGLVNDVWDVNLLESKGSVSAIVLDCSNASSATDERHFSKVVQTLVTRARNLGILVIVSVFSHSDINESTANLFDIKMRCGMRAHFVKSFWQSFAVEQWPDYQTFSAVYSAHVHKSGQYLVLSKVNGVATTKYWQPLQLKEPIAIRHDLVDEHFAAKLRKWRAGIQYRQFTELAAKSILTAFESKFVGWGIPAKDATSYAANLANLQVAVEDLHLVTETELRNNIGVTVLGHMLKFRRFQQSCSPIQLTFSSSNAN